jgi:tyrosyl-tRNA synthetase
MVHGDKELESAIEASQILFSNHAADTLRKIDEDTLLAVFEGVPTFEFSRELLNGETKLIDLLTDTAAVFPSKGEMRKLTQQGALSINKEKVADPYTVVTTDMLLDDKYILAQRGKKNYYLLIAR